eukprot:TRINITY_DN15798_c0_g1_i1.p1 TRINITY_DN15798_c0_g1~~TRINITY_DN15798_c0_g1_i1.p1  ORF type:complete len:226 (-),score=47.10 TRINITY_DN15798_c0_g1_i1:129-806(-)
MMSFFNMGAKAKATFKPQKQLKDGDMGYKLRVIADSTLGSGNLRGAVKLPPGEDVNEWLAVNTVDFYNQINMLYGTITEFCTPERCPVMSAGPKFEYHWADGVTIKKAIRVSAPDYVDRLMTWIQNQLEDESVFPEKIGSPFPKNFKDVVKKIFQRLFRVYGHMYHDHFQNIVSLNEEAHLNTSFKHFIYFVQEFKLVDEKELEPMSELIAKFEQKEREKGSGAV